MGFWKKFTGYLGFANHDLHEVNKAHDDEKDISGNNHVNSVEEIHHNYSNLPRKGFSVPVQVPVDRAHQIGPVLVPCVAGDGGVQGLKWYARRLKIDEDGDVADEFLEEKFLETEEIHQNQFQVKLNTKSAKARNPVLSREKEGTVQHYVEYRGRLLLA